MHHSIGTRPRSDWSIGGAQAKFVLAGLGVGHVSTVGFHKHFKYQDIWEKNEVQKSLGHEGMKIPYLWTIHLLKTISIFANFNFRLFKFLASTCFSPIHKFPQLPEFWRERKGNHIFKPPFLVVTPGFRGGTWHWTQVSWSWHPGDHHENLLSWKVPGLIKQELMKRNIFSRSHETLLQIIDNLKKI